MWNAISPGFELVSPCPIPATITITPRAPPVQAIIRHPCRSQVIYRERPCPVAGASGSLSWWPAKFSNAQALACVWPSLPLIPTINRLHVIDLVSIHVWLEAATNINSFRLAFVSDGDQDQCQIRGWIVPNFDWVTFMWATCIDNTA